MKNMPITVKYFIANIKPRLKRVGEEGSIKRSNLVKAPPKTTCGKNSTLIIIYFSVRQQVSSNKDPD